MGESFWAMHFRLISKLYLGLIYGETHSKSPQKYISQAQKLLDPFCMLVFKCVTSSTSGTLAAWKFRRCLRLFKDIIYIYIWPIAMIIDGRKFEWNQNINGA